MATQLLIVFVAVQGISAQCRGYRGPDNSCATPASLAASHGPGVTVASASKPPRGVAVASETVIEGNLEVAGKLPFLGAVSLEGVTPSFGKGIIDYNTGRLNAAITKEETKKNCEAFNPGAPIMSKTLVGEVPFGITLTASGGDLVVTSGSAMSPHGLSVISENKYEGPVSVVGRLPFLSVVSFNDMLPSAGYGNVAYKCGNELKSINGVSNQLNCNGRSTYVEDNYGKNGPCPSCAGNFKY